GVNYSSSPYRNLVPYQRDHRYCLNGQLRDLNQGLMDFKFMVHLGDIKSGQTPCYESSFGDVSEIFSDVRNAINYDPRDCFFVPGDNEFQDCQDKDQAWTWWMKYFGNGIIPNTNRFSTLSDPNIDVEYQTSTNGSVYNEGNFAFFAVNVLFVGLNQISFVVMGDMVNNSSSLYHILVPYQKDHRYCLNKQLRDLNQGLMDFKFMVHLGDIKSGQTPCYESSFSDVSEIFSNVRNAINYDLRDCFFVPGDNEFQDCQDKNQAWTWWMKYFGNGILPNTNQFSTLSDPNIDVEYQTSTNGSVYNGGNFAFFAVNVLFVGINQVGGGTVGDESSRVNGNYIWVQYNMAKYLSRGMRAIVIFAQASMNGSRQQYFGTPFVNLLRTSAYSRIKALYIHGDGHDYITYSPDSSNPNLKSLQVDGGEEADPLLISFMSDAVSDSISYTINRRGGQYSGTCPAGNTDKTWSSNY
ncbi:hypothetical protein ACHAXA_008798, partial [Cyclostephanos tholiformis]